MVRVMLKTSWVIILVLSVKGWGRGNKVNHHFYPIIACFTPCQTTVLNLSKLKAFADNKIKVNQNCFGKGRKHSGKRNKYWSRALPSLPIMFSNGVFSTGSVKALILFNQLPAINKMYLCAERN